ncbi:MAG: hypothetical protein JW801_01730 [Bacteroidales bacterium]|nr:hypothetical protein [Bacteroidales bacterium]
MQFIKFRQSILHIYGLYFCIAASSLAANTIAEDDFWTALQKNSYAATENTNSQEKMATVWQAFPMECEWLEQDIEGGLAAYLSSTSQENILALALKKAICETKELQDEFRDRYAGKDSKMMLNLYLEVCRERRMQRLAKLEGQCQQYLVIQRQPLDLSVHSKSLTGGSKLCLMQWSNQKADIQEILSDSEGILRDITLASDAKKLLFSWQKNPDKPQAAIYEMLLRNHQVRQVTDGKALDLYPAYLPDREILFTSDRCKVVSPEGSNVFNFYTCDPAETTLSRLGIEQYSMVSPCVLQDGRVLYSKHYEYTADNCPRPIFQMYPDATGIRPFYFYQSSKFQTPIQMRQCPDSHLVVGILSEGDHAYGQPVLVDSHVIPTNQPLGPVVGESSPGLRYLSPFNRKTKRCFQSPCPLSNDLFVIAGSIPAAKENTGSFGLYYMDSRGNTELLHYNPDQSYSEIVAVKARPRPFVRSSDVDASKKTGTVYVQTIYRDSGLVDYPRNKVQKVRMVGVRYRNSAVGEQRFQAGTQVMQVATPVGVGHASREVKMVLGEAPVYEDGSMMIEIPARIPVYLQFLNEQGAMVLQTSYALVLQPGEYYSSTTLWPAGQMTPSSNSVLTQAMQQGVYRFEGEIPGEGFSFEKNVASILGQNCAQCHNAQHPSLNLSETKIEDATAQRSWSLAYLSLTHAQQSVGTSQSGGYIGNPGNYAVCWPEVYFDYEPLRPCYAGSIRSNLVQLLANGHHEVKLEPSQLDQIRCWLDLGVPYCGDYLEANTWSGRQRKEYGVLIRQTENTETY